ncbi:hypothetical protein ACHQM5_001167 [Ranunculus cassubicifolius]
MAGLSLRCGDCGLLLKSTDEITEHAELTSHTDFSESTEAVPNFVCTTCNKPCRSKDEFNLHAKRTGHSDFVDLTTETAKPISLEPPKNGGGEGDEEEEMVVPEVDGKLVEEIGAMGFTGPRVTRALHYTGNSSVQSAINWIMEHENDMDIDELPIVPANAKPKPPYLALTEEEIKIKAQELLERARKKKEEEEKIMERKREKDRIRVGKELLEAKRIEEENERKRMVMLRKAEKAEEKRAREKIRQRIEEDKAERRRKLGLTAATTAPVVEDKKPFLPEKPATKAEQMRNCLRSLKQNHKEDDAKVKRAFQTLFTYVGNVAKNPGEEKFRKIRLSNPSFQDRVGSMKEGIDFLEMCGFGKVDDGEFLFLPSDKVDIVVLNSAGSELNSAIVNPYFGVL